VKTHFILLAALAAIILFSCRKTKLEDDKEILAGEWKWIYTEEYVDADIFSTANLESVIEADSFPKAYKLQFQNNGVMYRWQDNESTKDRMVIKTFEPLSSTWYVIRLRGDNKKKKELNMDLLDRATDTLIVDEYPFDDVNDANGRNYYHRNVFVRQ
jgi:hypothetical protein